MSRSTSSAAPRREPPVLLPLWVERNPILSQLDHMGVPRGRLTTLAGLETEEATALAEITSGRFEWPAERARTARLLGDPRTRPMDPPTRFHWRHPAAFINLPAVYELGVRLLAALRAEGMPPVRAEQEMALWADMTFHQCAWAAYGRRVYYLDPATMELLLQTRLPRFPVTELKAPMPSFVIAVPPDRFTFHVEADPTPQPVDSIHVTFSGEDDEAERDIAVLVAGRSRSGDPGDDNVVTGVIRLTSGANLDALTFSGTLAQYLRDDLVRVIVGLCLYLSAEHPYLIPVPAPKHEITAKNPAKRRKQEQRAARQSRLGYVWVGGGDPDTPDLAGVPHAGRTWALDHAFFVEGHWRQQAHGPGHSLRRRQWIRPYRKGPDFADALHQRAARVQPAQPSTPPEEP